ncbi:phosphatases II [Pseudovirgaria hyperparasitica]|uniref:protein-tyrosine-phosphatase n=1 Tax=Pseudovirgaria hyperparasitica TaxID=470096 RepID=A0A6A6WAU6_9PEZI|nr:phosphatases II [Pseudovirgaria hyperparasitica]KAF2759685.1 phosphatases II [Pseudovirgaria hyperparasitica]
MSSLDRVPGDHNIYIGGMFSLRRKDAFQKANITHVLSVLRMGLDRELFDPFHHMQIEVDDVEDENLLVHWPSTNKFIQEGLDGGGGVFVHCAMGKSRSAATVIAFLLQKHRIMPQEALDLLRQARPICEPNEGFMHQLQLFHEMNTPDDVESSPVYQRWMYMREVEMSRACGQAPDADKIRFEDEHTQSIDKARFEMKCRKCRRPLATSQFLEQHSKSTLEDKKIEKTGNPSLADCAHYFVDPLSWMRHELEQGKVEGRLECPKCRTNVGKYAWQGMQCSCGTWVVPGISLSRSRIDEVKARATAPGLGIRRPPGLQDSQTERNATIAVKLNL